MSRCQGPWQKRHRTGCLKGLSFDCRKEGKGWLCIDAWEWRIGNVASLSWGLEFSSGAFSFLLYFSNISVANNLTQREFLITDSDASVIEVIQQLHALVAILQTIEGEQEAFLAIMDARRAGAGSKEKQRDFDVFLRGGFNDINDTWWHPWGYHKLHPCHFISSYDINWSPSYMYLILYIDSSSSSTHLTAKRSSSIAMRNLCACPSNAKELLHDSVKAAAAAAVPHRTVILAIESSTQQKNCCNSDQLHFDVVCCFSVCVIFLCVV